MSAPVLTFDAPSHTYTLDGVRLPSVTQILDSLGGYAGIPADVMERKREIGDAVHYATELFDRGELDEQSVPDAIQGYVDAYKRFRAETGFEPRAIESRVYSARMQYTGTLDRTGTFWGLSRVRRTSLALVDLKCTYRLMASAGPQTAAYAYAHTERTGEKIRHRFALQLRPDGAYTLKEQSDPSDFSVFVAAKTLMNWKSRHKV